MRVFGSRFSFLRSCATQSPATGAGCSHSTVRSLIYRSSGATLSQVTSQNPQNAPDGRRALSMAALASLSLS